MELSIEAKLDNTIQQLTIYLLTYNLNQRTNLNTTH